MGHIPALPGSGKKRPVASYPEKKTHIKSGEKPSTRCWVFNFRFWRQIEYFGLDRVESTWIVSVLEKFQELSNKAIGDFVADNTTRDAWRYHQIDWSKKNIPIQRKDLSWLPVAYRENEEDYPLYQFQVSQTLGRVIGFWDETQDFNVVLLDPFHNMQPTKATGYRVDPCDPLACDYSLLIDHVNRVASTKCVASGCEITSSFLTFDDRKKKLQSFNVLMLSLPDSERLVEAQRLIDSEIISSHVEIFEYGLAKIVEDFSLGK